MQHGAQISTLEPHVKAKKVDLFRSKIEMLPELDRKYMTLPKIADILEMDLQHQALMDCVISLVDNEILDVRAQYVDAHDGIHELDPDDYRKAMQQGHFTDPSTGLIVEDTSLLAPFWSVSERLMAAEFSMTG
jgi:hypothetical protein